jgi:hypothetical protein
MIHHVMVHMMGVLIRHARHLSMFSGAMRLGVLLINLIKNRKLGTNAMTNREIITEYWNDKD